MRRPLLKSNLESLSQETKSELGKSGDEIKGFGAY